MTDIYTTDKKYSIIYADPPWQYFTYSKKGQGRSAESHYPTMPKAEIQKLPVPRISAKDSVLFLWATAPCLIEAFELIEAWGFTYKTVGFTWIKQCRKSDKLFLGMGYCKCGVLPACDERENIGAKKPFGIVGNHIAYSGA